MTTIQQKTNHLILGQATANTDRVANFDIAELQRMERQLIPLLNTVRQMQGKRPVIVPGEKRTRDG